MWLTKSSKNWERDHGESGTKLMELSHVAGVERTAIQILPIFLITLGAVMVLCFIWSCLKTSKQKQETIKAQQIQLKRQKEVEI